MKRAILCIFLLAAGVSAAAGENKKPCTNQEAILAEEQASSLKNWAEVYEAYKIFSHCDDGAIGEGYSDSISRLLSEEWSTIYRLSQLTSRDKNFERFVLKHTDELMSPDQAEKIRENAETGCPLNAEPLCQAISLRIRDVDKAVGKEKTGGEGRLR